MLRVCLRLHMCVQSKGRKDGVGVHLAGEEHCPLMLCWFLLVIALQHARAGAAAHSTPVLCMITRPDQCNVSSTAPAL